MPKYIFSFYFSWVCNIACSYCHQKDTVLYNTSWKEELLKKSSIISSENIWVAVNIINQISRNSSVHINFFWGETFLYKKQILSVIDALKLWNLNNISISISTNGSILDRDILYAFNHNWFKKSIIDISWHVIESPFLLPKIEQLCNIILTDYIHIDLKSTVVIATGCFENRWKYIELFSKIHKSTRGRNIVLNIDYWKHWLDKEIQELLYTFQAFKKYRVTERFSVIVDFIECWALHQDSTEIFFLPNGDIILCPYLIMTKLDKSYYDDFKSWNLSTDHQETILEMIINNKDEHLYCKSKKYTQGKCFFLGKRIELINLFIQKQFY